MSYVYVHVVYRKHSAAHPYPMLCTRYRADDKDETSGTWMIIVGAISAVILIIGGYFMWSSGADSGTSGNTEERRRLVAEAAVCVSTRVYTNEIS